MLRSWGDKMKITEIFKSISGESIQAGYPATFIRTHGCLLRCSYCDSMYAVEGDGYGNMSIAEILETVLKLNCKRIVLTGGEPLIQHDAFDLVQELLAYGCSVEIETCGAVDISKYILPGVIVTMDWKSISSGMNGRMLPSNLSKLRDTDVLKFVVSTEDDLEDMAKVSTQTKAQCFVSPIFGKIDPQEIVMYLIQNDLNNIRIQLQLHKIIWDPNRKGV